MKNKGKVIGIIILFLAGLSLLLYPLVANQWNSYRQSRLISTYEGQVSDLENGSGREPTMPPCFPASFPIPSPSPRRPTNRIRSTWRA